MRWCSHPNRYVCEAFWINFWLRCSTKVKVAGVQVRRPCRPWAHVYHIFIGTCLQVWQCSPGSVERSTVLLEKTMHSLVPWNLATDLNHNLQILISVALVAKQMCLIFRWSNFKLIVVEEFLVDKLWVFLWPYTDCSDTSHTHSEGSTSFGCYEYRTWIGVNEKGIDMHRRNTDSW